MKSKGMSDILLMVLAFMAGVVLGTLFFGGLWLTVKVAFTSKMPALWFFGSFLLRISITLMGFYYIAAGNWQRLLVTVPGFVAARYLVMRLTKKEINHGS
jgi:F1F0 ATPase subunit 2